MATETLWSLIQDVRAEIKERLDEDPDQDLQDLAHEVADSNVPVYTSDIMAVGAEDISMATNEPECGPAFDGSPTPVNIIAANIYERLYDEAWEELRLWQERTGRDS